MQFFLRKVFENMSFNSDQNSYEIRRASFTDLSRIQEIYKNARKFMAEHGNPRQWGLTGWPSEEVLKKDIGEGNCYICLAFSDIVGTFTYEFGKDIEPTYCDIQNGHWLTDLPYGVIHRMASDGVHKGIGSFCINWAFRQSRHLRIDTHPDNIVMQNLLAKLGFTKCGIIHVVQDNDPRYAYEKYCRVVLASASPRRIELLHQIGVDAEVIPSHQPEKVSSSDPQKVVEELSRQKALNITDQLLSESGNLNPAALSSGHSLAVIGADTVVAVDGKILGKPATHEEAFDMIHELSGRVHHVFTGVTIWHDGETETFSETTAVYVVPMSLEEIRTYADSEEPMDKAGGYGIQGKFGRYIRGIEGDYNNVVGLPVAHLYRELNRLGLA